MYSLAISTYQASSNWEFIKEQAEKFQATDVNKKRALEIDDLPQDDREVKKFKSQAGSNEQKKISDLSNELTLHVLGFLPPKDLGRVAGVCKEWRSLAYDNSLWKAIEKRLPSLYPSLSIIDRTVWETHVDLDAFGLNVEDPLPKEDVQPLSKRAILIPIIRAIKEITPLVEGNAGVTLLTIPKGLTFNKLVALAGSPKQGNQAQFAFIWKGISEEFGDIDVDTTYRVVISNSVLNGSRKQSITAQQELVNGHGCEIPGVLEVSTLAILTYMVSLARLYGDNPLTYTRCREMLVDYRRLAVGSFLEEGLFVVFNNFEHNEVGVGCLRK